MVPQLRFSARNKIKNLLISLKKKGVIERLGCSFSSSFTHKRRIKDTTSISLHRNHNQLNKDEIHRIHKVYLIIPLIIKPPHPQKKKKPADNHVEGFFIPCRGTQWADTEYQDSNTVQAKNNLVYNLSTDLPMEEDANL